MSYSRASSVSKNGAELIISELIVTYYSEIVIFISFGSDSMKPREGYGFIRNS